MITFKITQKGIRAWGTKQRTYAPTQSLRDFILNILILDDLNGLTVLEKHHKLRTGQPLTVRRLVELRRAFQGKDATMGEVAVILEDLALKGYIEEVDEDDSF